MGTKSIWTDILLKEVFGYELKNTVTIFNNEKDYNRKYQIFEILVIETLALIDSTTKWQATFGNKDQGVDIVGIRKNQCKTPFYDKTPDQLYLGQIKRRNSGYRYDDFRTDINKLFEFYSSKILYKDATLMQLIFVISSDNANNVKNLRKNLLKDFDNKSHLVFIAGIKSPIVIIDALDIIKYWKINFGFVRKIIEVVFSESEMEQFEAFLEDINFSGISFSIKQNANACLGRIYESRVKLTTNITNIPMEIYLKWFPAAESLGRIQLISPWGLCENFGIHVYIENIYEIPILFRGISVGEYNLGELEVTYPNSTYKQRIPLGSIYVQKNPFPIYFESPNYDIKIELEKILTDEHCNFYACAILGCGGIGKSSLLSEVVIKAVNNGFYCVDIGYSHNLTSGNSFPIQIILKILSQSLHRIVFVDEIAIHIQTFLGVLYKEEWNGALNNLIEERQFNIDYICDCIISLLIKLTWQVPCVLWFSDMHWLNNMNADLLRRIFFSLKNNPDYIDHKLIVFFEGRLFETLFVDNKHYMPHVWEEFLEEINIERKQLRNWKEEECKDFLDTLFSQQQEICDVELMESIKSELLSATSGVPMHILEQLKFLIEQGKIIVKNNGELYVFERNWTKLLSDNLKELVSFRIHYYHQKYEQIMDYLVVYAKLNLYIIPACAKYTYKLLSRNYFSEINVLENISFIEIKDGVIRFQHEYYSEGLKKLPVKYDETIDNILKWFQKKSQLTDYESLCQLQLLEMFMFVDYEYLSAKIVSFLSNVSDEYMKQQAYQMLLEIPEDILQNRNLTLYEIKYQLCESIILTGDWKLAKKYFLELVDSINSEDLQEVYYGALAYQDLSNISSGELLLDEAIMYANKGIELVENMVCAFDNQNFPEFLMQAKDLLIERKAICYEFAGYLDMAFEFQRQAYESAALRNDEYVMLRVNYERGSTTLHTNLDDAVSLLSICYKKAISMHMKFQEEPVLIKTIEFVGKVKQLYLLCSNSETEYIYREAIFLAEHQQKKQHNYSASIHLITIAALVLLKDDNPHKALNYLFQSLERALDTHLNELLWKSYLNIAQLKYYLNYYDESKHYALKALSILEDMIRKNPENKEAIISLIYDPLRCIEYIVGTKLEWLNERKFMPNRLKIHSYIWNTIELFVMN